jgi:tryptophan 7-halogenase
MKKLTIVGRGTAGVQGALHFNRHLDKSKFEMEWLFDDSIPTQSVGEGSTLQMPRLMHETSGFGYRHLPKLGGCVKLGIKKSGWGSGKEFTHDFAQGGVGYHFQAALLHKYGLDYLKDRIHINDEHVGSTDDIDSDFVFDCSGRPKSFNDDFLKSDAIAVNAAKVWQCTWDEPKFNYTLALARPYGWVFGIPLSDRLSLGYIYNKDYATPEQIEDDMQEVFKLYDIDAPSKNNYIEFDSYWRNENFNERVGYSGNASFFLEPLEATSTATMDVCNRNMFDIVTGSKDIEYANKNYTEALSQAEDMIMLHYAAGSQWDTDFWRYAKDRGERKLAEAKDNTVFKKVLKESLRMAKAGTHITEFKKEYAFWGVESFAKHITKLDLMDKVNSVVNGE